MNVNYVISKDNDGKRLIHLKGDNIETITGNETDEIANELFQSLLIRYRIGLERPMKGSDFIFERADGVHYQC